ncbi:hypothetical protein ACQBAR_15825 [Propionibacteriaceae bacterium Y1685]
MSRRSTTIPWRRLGVRMAVAGGGALVVCLLAMLIGFELDVSFIVLLAMTFAVAGWFVFQVVDPAEQPRMAKLALEAESSGRFTDRRVLKIEEQLYGADPKRRMTTGEMQRLLSDIVRHRLERRQRTLEQEIAQPTVLTPALISVLTADPPPALTRTRLRLLIKEIAAS